MQNTMTYHVLYTFCACSIFTRLVSSLVTKRLFIALTIFQNNLGITPVWYRFLRVHSQISVLYCACQNQRRSKS